ncbi:MAG TPA: nucleotidyltransferase domain-containing protein [Candidatus Hydrogenedentes bacterium]|nr:nucleotidyltransferase domain-containing protein [Candidatus Hydrogenedentota bacterium]
MNLPIQINQEDISDFCKRRHILKLSLFGSVLTDRFGPESDVDVLVEFDPDNIPTLFDVVEMERELSRIVGRKADIRTAKDLSRYFREEAVKSAVVQYAA